MKQQHYGLPIFIALAMAFCQQIAFAQFQVQHVSTASYQDEFEGFTAACLKSDVVVEFKYDAQSGQVIVQQSFVKNLISLDTLKPSAFTFYFDNHSSLEYVKQNNISLHQGKYHSNGLYNQDAQFCSYLFENTAHGDVNQLAVTKTIDNPIFYNLEFFNEQYPVKHKRLQFIIPDNIEVVLTPFNTEYYTITKDSLYVEEKKHTVLEFGISNLQAFSKTKYTPSINRTYPHFLIQIKSYTNRENEQVAVIKNVNDLYQWHRHLNAQTDYNIDRLKPFLATIIEESDSDMLKMEKIYKWMQEQSAYFIYKDNLSADYYANTRLIIEKEYLDSKGLANITKALLCFAGFDARICWLGTDDLIYDYSTPSLAADNHMITAVFYQGDTLFLDATAYNYQIGEYPLKIQGKRVLIEDGDNYILDKVPNLDYHKNKMINTYMLSAIDGRLRGNFISQISGSKKAEFIHGYNFSGDHKEGFINSFLFSGNNPLYWDLDELKIDHLSKDDYQISFPVAYAKRGIKIGRRNILSVFPYHGVESMEVDTNLWMSEIDLKAKGYVTDSVVIDLGEYDIKKLPENYTYENSWVGIHYKFESNGEQIFCTRTLEVKSKYFPREELEQWNEMAKEAQRKNNSHIMLVQKKSPIFWKFFE